MFPAFPVVTQCSVQVRYAFSAISRRFSLSPIASLSTSEDDEHAPLDYYLSAEDDPSEALCEHMTLTEAIRALTPLQQKIVHLRYERDLSQCAVGRILGLSQVKVSREEKKILTLLREKLTAE